MPQRKDSQKMHRSLARIKYVLRRCASLSLQIVERLDEMPFLISSLLSGVHLGELLKLDVAWFKEAGIRTVFDVGAHKGEFASAVRAVIPTAQIYSFEPLPQCYDELLKRMEKDPLFAAFPVAIGSEPGDRRFWQSSFTKSSSLLPMAALHRNSFPWSDGNTETTVRVETLDSYLGRICITPKVLLKIDVQGYEDKVLRGGSRLIQHVDYVLTEVSFKTLYEGQALFDEVYKYLTEAGFAFSGSMDQLLSPEDGSVLQADALFSRTEKARQ